MKVILIFLSILVLFSCSKEKQTKRLLCRNWELIKVQIEDGEGFSYVSEDVAGTISITENLQLNGQVSYAFNSIQGTTVRDTVTWDAKNFTFSDSKTMLLNDWQPASSIRILILTKSNAQLVYYDMNQYRLVGLIFKRKV
ncbi:MAG: hypothetical protein RL264_2950 [Bacteroidota bacterium]|jgi:hypothetical protein